MLDAVAGRRLNSTVAHLARTDALVMITAAFDALALRDLTRAAILDPLAAVLERATRDRVAFSFETCALTFESFTATEIPIAALLFALAADLLALAFDFLAHAARFFRIAGALDRFAGATLADRLRTRLCRKNQDRKSR